MDEDISIIDSKTRNEKIKNFFINNKKYLIGILSSIIIVIFVYLFYEEIKDRKIKNLAEKYNNISIKYNSSNKMGVKNELIEIINEKNSTYSPLALYFIIDNEIEASNEEINKFFDTIINEVNLEKEIKNLIIYKKGLYNADKAKENELLEILRPLINTKSVWSSHALYLIAEFFYSKDEKQKAKDFFNKILETDKANQDIIKETRKRLSRDLSD